MNRAAREAEQQARYWLTAKGYAALAKQPTKTPAPTGSVGTSTPTRPGDSR